MESTTLYESVRIGSTPIRDAKFTSATKSSNVTNEDLILYNKRKIAIAGGMRRIIKILKRVFPEILNSNFASTEAKSFIQTWTGTIVAERSLTDVQLSISHENLTNYTYIRCSLSTKMGKCERKSERPVSVSNDKLFDYFSDEVTLSQVVNIIGKTIDVNEEILELEVNGKR